MSDRAALGAAEVSDGELAEMVARSLGVDAAELVESTAEIAPYDLEALTTAGRFWVHGSARHSDGESPFRFYVKVVQSWERSPIFAWVPEEMRELALASVPWRREPDVYRSDLAARLPAGLSMPTAYSVIEIDELSAAIWLQAIDVLDVEWQVERFAEAAYLLGRLAASPAVAPLGAIGDVGNVPRGYHGGRLASQVVPALLSEQLWEHPLLKATFDERLRADLQAAVAAMPAYLDELDDMQIGTIHGDACRRNLLLRRGDPNGFVLIDYGFWGRAPLGFDLSQLLIGDVQTGERAASCLPSLERACLPAYHQGLRDEGVDVDVDRLRRAHALLMLEFAGLSAVPFELLEAPPTDEGLRITTERAAAARFILDLVADTA
ncbi:MAG: phosphotransferase [Sporichthyaceae bacterium]